MAHYWVAYPRRVQVPFTKSEKDAHRIDKLRRPATIATVLKFGEVVHRVPVESSDRTAPE